jgi:hypothetical protein
MKLSNCTEMVNEFHAAQSKADAVYTAFNDSAPAPLVGERLIDYRLRLLKPLQPHSAAWRNTEIPANEQVLKVAETQVYADAAAEARAPSNVPAGTLVERIEKDITGRRITRFFGDPEACWGPFKIPAKCVTGWSGAK